MRRRVAAIVLFLLLLAGVTGAAGKIVSAKFINDSTTMINGFYAEDKKSIDVTHFVLLIRWCCMRKRGLQPMISAALHSR